MPIDLIAYRKDELRKKIAEAKELDQNDHLFCIKIFHEQKN